MADQETVDLGAGKLLDTDYPIKVSVQIAARPVTRFSRWLPVFGDIDPIPETWNIPKPGWMILVGDQPKLCNTGRDTGSWTGTWLVSRTCSYKCDCAIVSDARTGKRLFAVTGMNFDTPKNDDGTWTFPEDNDITMIINNVSQ